MLGRLLHLSRYLSHRLLIIHEVIEFQLPEQVQIWTPILTRNIRNIFGQTLSDYCEKIQMKAQFVEFWEGLSNVLQDLILCILNCGDLHSCCQWYRIQVSPWSIPDRQQCKPHQPNLVLYTREDCPQHTSCRLPKIVLRHKQSNVSRFASTNRHLRQRFCMKSFIAAVLHLRDSFQSEPSK